MKALLKLCPALALALAITGCSILDRDDDDDRRPAPPVIKEPLTLDEQREALLKTDCGGDAICEAFRVEALKYLDAEAAKAR